MNKKGYSLVEILVGFAIVAMVFAIAGSVLFTTLKSSRKAAAIALAKSEGAYAIRAMSDKIRFAQSVVCDPVTNNRLQVNRDGPSLVYFFDTSTNPDRIASRGGTLAAYTAVNLDLTSNTVAVSLAQCGGQMFTCLNGNKTVSICFGIDNAAGMDVTDRAGVSGTLFRTQITLPNLGN